MSDHVNGVDLDISQDQPNDTTSEGNHSCVFVCVCVFA